MHRSLALLLFLPACFDASPPDEPLTCADLATRTFAIDRVTVPHDADGDVTGLDLDHDADPDNQGGVLLDDVFGIYDAEGAEAAWTAQLQARFDGDLLWLVQLQTCGDGATRLALHQGVRDGALVRIADPTPADGEAPVRAAAGVALDGRVIAGGGTGVAPLGALADILGGADPAWHQGISVGADLVLGDGRARGTLGLGFAPPYRMVVGASFLGWLNARLAAGQSSYGRILDANHDGTITYEELDVDSVFTLLMRPDLDALGHDGVAESYSFGVDIDAVEVRVE